MTLVAGNASGANPTYTATITPAASGTVTADTSRPGRRRPATRPPAVRFSIIAHLTLGRLYRWAGAIACAALLLVRGARRTASGPGGAGTRPLLPVRHRFCVRFDAGVAGRPSRRRPLTVAAVPRPGRFRDLTRPVGHHPLNIRSGRRYGSPPVSRSQAARAATGPLMRTFLGEVRTAPVRCAGGGAGGRAGFRSSPPATSERDHSTR